MTLLSRNVDLARALKLSPWRKVAIGTWRSAGDPSVYGIVEYEVQATLDYLERLQRESGQKITLTHFVGRALAEAMKRHPGLNCILRFGRLYPRKSVDIFFQVASDQRGDDLSGMTVRQAEQKSLPEIAAEMRQKVERIRKDNDPAFAKMKNLFGFLPGFLAAPLISISGTILYALNLWSPLLGVPRDSFGSAMVTSIGSIGLETAFAPLVPYSRVPLLVAVGAVREQAVVKDGQVVAAKVIRLCATFDHRLIDGVQAAHMSRTLGQIFANPAQELT